MKFGDRIRIEMFDAAGKSIFGAIDQKVVRYTPPASANHLTLSCPLIQWVGRVFGAPQGCGA